jgi:hypothetical protein
MNQVSGKLDKLEIEAIVVVDKAKFGLITFIRIIQKGITAT